MPKSTKFTAGSAPPPPKVKRSFLYANLFTFTATALCLVVLAFVPQVRQVVWSQVPPPSFTGWTFAWIAFLVFLLIYFAVVATSILIVPRPYYTGESRLVATIHKTLGWTVWAWNTKASRWPKATIVFAFVASVMGILSLFLYGPESDSSRWYLLAGALCHNIGIWLLMFGLWLFACLAMLGPKSFPTEQIEGVALILLILGRLLAWLFLANLVGEALWAAASISWLLASHIISFRVYMLWAVLHIMTLIVIGARILDYLDRSIGVPVRALGLAALFGLAVLLRPNTNADIQLVPINSPKEKVQLVDTDKYEERNLHSLAISDRWYQYLEDRLTAIPEDDPVVIVAASGGGSRAAIFSALLFEFLARERIQNSAGVAPRQDEPKWADNILLVSCVSGGSLATGHFVGRMCKPSEVVTKTRYTIHDELVTNFQSELENLGTQVSAAREGEDWEECRKFAENIRQTIANAPLNSQWAWLIHSAFIDDMGTNFMAPILRGSTAARLYRGDALGRFWSELYGWNDCDNLDGYHGVTRWVGSHSKYPLVLFNASDVARGSRLAIGFPPLPHDVFPEWRHQPKITHHPPQELVHLFSDHQSRISLAKAIRLSSNFPWGFYSSRIQEPGSETETLVLDGGIVDNTGLDTLTDLIYRLRLTPRGQDIVRSLANRRVVLIEVDSGAKPTEPSALGRLLGGTFDPIQALTNATYTNADRARDHYIKQFRSDLFSLPGRARASDRSDEPSDKVRTAGELFPITVKCNHFSPDAPDRGAVMTAWALNPRDKASVIARFVYEIPLLQKSLRRVEDERGPVVEARQIVDKLEQETSFRRLTERLLQEHERSQFYAKFIRYLQQSLDEEELHYLRVAIVRQREIVHTAREALEAAAAKRTDTMTYQALDKLATSVTSNLQLLGMDAEEIKVVKTPTVDLSTGGPTTNAQESVKAYAVIGGDFTSEERQAFVVDLARVKQQTENAGYRVEQISKQSQSWFEGNELKASTRVSAK